MLFNKKNAQIFKNFPRAVGRLHSNTNGVTAICQTVFEYRERALSNEAKQFVLMERKA